MEFQGVGSPAVVFDAGMNGITRGWHLARDSVAAHTQTVVFERAGFGDSEVGPSPRDARQLSRELYTALKNAGVDFPVILVGHSAGGLFSTVFAGLYPDAIAGLILVDPATAEAYEAMGEDDPAFWESRADATPYETDGWKAPPGWIGQMEALPQSVQQFWSAFPLPQVPTVVLTAMVPIPGEPIIDSAEDMVRWRGFHVSVVEQIPGAIHHVFPEANHVSILQEPMLRTEVIRVIAVNRE
jgi:pimeloyl-ACP methyl ester carboxylesterase